MTDHRASFEGPPHARQSPEALSDHGEGDSASGAQPTSSVPRRRPLRTKTASDDSQPASPTWADTDKGDLSRKARGGRATPRKSSKLSPQSDTKLDSSVPSEKAAVGFFPKLSRILEGKENRAPRRQPSSTVGSAEDHTLPRRRHHQPAEDATLSRRSIRQKHGSLQRRVESLVNLPNPSLMSVLSGVTQQSNVSSGSNESNSTITQQAYDRSQIVKRKPTRVRKRMQAKRGLPQGKSDTMDAQQAGVFRYMSESLSSEQFCNSEPHASRPSTASSSSSATSHETEDGDLSSNGNEEGLGVDSRMTSPASMRRPYHKESDDDAGKSGSGMSVREASPDSHRQPSVSDDVEDGDEVEKDPNQGEGVEAEHSEYSEDDGEDDGGGNASATDEVEHEQHHAHNMALECVPPPRIPSTSSSRHSDRHTRRLRRQEQALNEHVLQAPKPKRDFQFVGGPSPQTLPPHPAIPMYDPYVHSGASPANFYTTAHHAPPPAPPPPIGYYSPPHAPPGPYSSGYENNVTISTHPPVAAPSAMVSAPPFQYPAHPPHYQPHATVPDLSKTTVVGYELLADKLCEGSKVERRHPNQEIVVPMYRKFEQLNHRVLLHLQDEISELEEELRHLDECIAQCSPRDGAGLIHPASRRGDARYGSDLHFRRTELLGRIYLKLGQYNAALTSFNNMVKNVDAADTEDIRAYRSWIEKRTPIDYAETRFLKHSADLLAVSRSKSASIASGVSSHQSAAMFLPLILVLPLMAFAIVPGLLGRLFVLVVISGGIIKLIMSTKELIELMTAREWSVCFSGYFGLMVVLAALVH